MKQVNILVDDAGTVRVADFGLMAMVEVSTVVLSRTSVSSGGTYCWMSPELLDPEHFGCSGHPTRESDCYALGMVIYEVSWLWLSCLSLVNPPQVLSGCRPFHDLRAYSPVRAVLGGVRPEKPLCVESLRFSDVIWGLVRSCWSELPSSRPVARQLFDHLSSVSPAWDPPPSLVYPAVFTDDFRGSTVSDSSGTSRTSLVGSTHESGEW